jgi:hypothetical protein
VRAVIFRGPLAFVVALAAIGCERAAPEPGPPSWWCWDDGLCFRSRDICSIRKAQIEITSTCVAHERAFCRYGCDQLDGGGVSCAETCVADEALCEEPCMAKRVPDLPAKLSSSYTRPGFWCWEHANPDGTTVSSCEKYQEECDFHRAQRGATEPCVARDHDVICFLYDMSQRIETHAACFTSDADCERTRPEIIERGTPLGFTAFTDCAPWPYP